MEDSTVIQILFARDVLVDTAVGRRRPILGEAAFNGQNETISLLLRRGAAINQLDADGFSPIFHAVLNRHDDTFFPACITRCSYLTNMHADNTEAC